MKPYPEERTFAAMFKDGTLRNVVWTCSSDVPPWEGACDALLMTKQVHGEMPTYFTLVSRKPIVRLTVIQGDKA